MLPRWDVRPPGKPGQTALPTLEGAARTPCSPGRGKLRAASLDRLAVNRQLLFFAGRVPKRRISSLRGALYLSLRNHSNVSLHVTFVNPAEQPPGFTPSHLPYDEYVERAMSSRFCVVASGDNMATPKFTEAILVASQGGCIPFVFCLSRICPWPWHERLPLHKAKTRCLLLRYHPHRTAPLVRPLPSRPPRR